MNNTLRFFVGVICLVAMPAMAAVSIKKAAPVATQQVSKVDGVGGLVGTATTLIKGITDLTKQTKELSQECQPTSSEVADVNELVKEWAKTGAASADDVKRALGRKPCDVSSGVGGYEASIKLAIDLGDKGEICYDSFKGGDNDGKVWENFPRVGTATYCANGDVTCKSKNQRTTSDIYEIFALITFSDEDYTRKEAEAVARIKEKFEKCSGTKLDQAKNAMWGSFLQGTIGNLGQNTGTASIMDAVGGLVSSGGGSGLGGLGGLGGLSSIGGLISNTMNK